LQDKISIQYPQGTAAVAQSLFQRFPKSQKIDERKEDRDREIINETLKNETETKQWLCRSLFLGWEIELSGSTLPQAWKYRSSFPPPCSLFLRSGSDGRRRPGHIMV
jgi:hypothetical protein